MKKKQRLLAWRNRARCKMALLMKLSLPLLLTCLIQFSVSAHSQNKITLKLRNLELTKAIALLELKSDYRFVYNNSLIPADKKIDANFREADLPEIMDKLLDGTTLSYKMMKDNLVVLFQPNLNETRQDVRISGRVTDDKGNPLGGASINVKGKTTGTNSGVDGQFSLTVPDNAILVVSYIGYETVEVAVGGRTAIEVKLKEATKKMDEVVVIGYGSASKRDLTGSITKVSGREVADRPNSNPVSSLQSKVAGLSVVNNGTPGSEPDIRLRGTLSFSGIKPLYVVDGIFNDNIDYLNPNDIESIEVLKDASSLAIFGVRGASGVIAITTKKAKAGQVVVNLSSNFGFKQLVDKIKLVDAAGFKLLYDEEQANLGIPASDRFDFTNWQGNTDWIDILTRTGQFNNNNLSISGSTDRNKFYMGLGITTDEGLVKNEKLEKYFLTFNDEFKVNKAIKVGFNTTVMRQRLPFSQASGLLFDARRILPITEAFNTEKGVYNQLAIQAGQIANPLMNLEEKWDKELRYENRIVGSIFAEINFLKNFNFRTTIYGDVSSIDQRTYNPIISIYNPTVTTNGGVFVDPNNRTTSVNQTNADYTKVQEDYILTYKKSFGEHGLTATAGMTRYYFGFRNLKGSVSQRADGDPIPNDERFWYITNGFGDPTTLRASQDPQYDKTTVSYLVRLLYNYKGKYLLNASYRNDASSQISPLARNQSFYAVGAAWELTKESFMDNVKFFDFLKLKASWGVLGNQAVNRNYPYYPNLLTGSTAVFGNSIFPSYTLEYEPERNLKWESLEAQEIGVEFNAFKNKLHMEIAYFKRTTKDILYLVDLGNNRRRLDNTGSVENNGLEMSGSWNQPLAKDLTLTVNGNITFISNKVLSIPDPVLSSEERPNKTEQGFPLGYFYGLVVEGVYQTKQEILKSPIYKLGGDPIPGDLKYKDVNGDGFIDSKDRTQIGNPTPDFSYGGSVTLNYKGFDLSIEMGGVYGNEVYRYWGSSELPFTKFNYPEFKLNRWRGVGTSNWDPIIGDRAINRQPSTYGIEDGSYFRIRNLQLGYNFDKKLVEKAHLKSLRLYGNVQNLKTFKNNSGYSPEFGGDAFSFGIDNGNNAIPMIISFGLNLTF